MSEAREEQCRHDPMTFKEISHYHDEPTFTPAPETACDVRIDD